MEYTIPHFRNLAQNGYGDPSLAQEGIYLSLFQIEFVLPIALQRAGYNPTIFLTSAKGVNVPITPELPTISQRFMYSTRLYVGLPESTSIEGITIPFELNLNPDNNVMEAYNALKAWYNLAWNSETGLTSYKRDMAGIINIWQYDRKGKVIRRISYLNAMCKGISDLDLAWESTNELWSPSATFCCDVWEDVRIDPLDPTIPSLQ